MIAPEASGLDQNMSVNISHPIGQQFEVLLEDMVTASSLTVFKNTLVASRFALYPPIFPLLSICVDSPVTSL